MRRVVLAIPFPSAEKAPAMAGHAIRDFWLSVTGQKDARGELPDVIVHDPAAQRAHDLDDPFFDDKIQTRMADVIADAAQKK